MRRSLSLALVGALLVAACAHAGAASGSALMIEVAEADLDAEVYVDGNYVGQVRALSQRSTDPLVLAPGVHRVEVRKPGRFPVQRTIRVDKRPPAAIVVAAELLEDPEP